MAQPDYDFEYSWEDLKPVRPLFVTMLVAQGLGLLAGLLFGRDGGWVERAFVWGAPSPPSSATCSGSGCRP
jgi:hypothetical protein